jgi:hypothetical protein
VGWLFDEDDRSDKLEGNMVAGDGKLDGNFSEVFLVGFKGLDVIVVGVGPQL